MNLPPGSLLVISPHLDDAAMGCGTLLAERPGSVVVSVFAGTGPDPDRQTEWDRSCGFRCAAEAMAARRDEDDCALSLLGAVPCRLDFADDQYRNPDDPGDVLAIATALRTALSRFRPDIVAMPCGLFHRDHVLAHEAALQVVSHNGLQSWLAYEDANYRRIPGLLQRRLCELAASGYAATPIESSSLREDAVKEKAIRCYASQVRGLLAPGRPGYRDALAPERYWHLSQAEGRPVA